LGLEQNNFQLDMKRKIKVFLGGYVNFLNAQNINCRAISEHIDKHRFEVSTMLFWYQDACDFKPVPRVKYLRLRRPARLWMRLVYLRGIASADVAYLPKGEIDGYCRTVARIFHTKVFTTVEGVLDSVLQERVGKDKFPSYINHFKKYDDNNLYSITKYIKRQEIAQHKLSFSDKILYLGVNSSCFNTETLVRRGELNNVIFIGNDPIRKNIYDLFDAAEAFTDINFHIVGGNEIKEGKIEDYIAEHGLTNVTYHGRLDHTHLAELLRDMDLMYFPSRSEGFPKVHLETACAGVPTLCYGDYGAHEWITSWKNGIVVDTKDEAFDAIARLKANPRLLADMSKEAVELGKSFDWKKLIKDWEIEIERIYNS